MSIRAIQSTRIVAALVTWAGLTTSLASSAEAAPGTSQSRPIAAVIRGLLGCALCCVVFGYAIGVATASAAIGDLTAAGCIGNSPSGGSPGPASCIGVDGLSGADAVAVSPDGRSVYVAGDSGNAVNVFQRAANGDLTPAGCVGDSGTGASAGPASCIAVNGLSGPESVTVSPDGTSVYVASYLGNSVNVFHRAANGDLTPAGCIGNSGTGSAAGPAGCIAVDGLAGASSVAVSPDGQSVYVTAIRGNAVNVFRRALNGDLTPAGCIGNSAGTHAGPASCIVVDGLAGAIGVTVSPDGQSVYVAGYDGNAVNVFRRAGNGDLTPAGCIGNSGTDSNAGPANCIGVVGLAGPQSVAVSPDGQSVYVAAHFGNAVNVFRRAGNGDLTPAGCIATSGSGSASCTEVDGLARPTSVTVSPDGQSVYVAGYEGNAVNVFRRAANGDLSRAGCMGNSGPAAGPTSCILVDGLQGAFAVTVSPDGLSVYTAALESNALVVFRRATSTLPPAGSTPTGGTIGGSSPTLAPRTDTVAVGNQTIQISTPLPAGCLAKSASLTTSLTLAASAGRASDTLRFARATLRIDRGVRHVLRRTRLRNGKRVTRKTIAYTANRTVHTLPATVSLSLAGLATRTHTLSTSLVFRKKVTGNGKHRTIPVAKTRSLKFSIC